MSSRFVMMGILGSATMLATGCGLGSGSQPGQSAQPQTGPVWTLTLKSTCVDAAQDQCVGKYGFSVSADGTYQVGPGPQGQLRTGKVTDSELELIKAKVENSTAPAANGENHEGDFAHVANDTVSLARSGTAARMLVRNEGPELTFTVQSTVDAHALHAAIRGLANGYYRLPFGNECGDAADKFAAAAESVQSCQTDMDCSYVRGNGSFSVIPPTSSEYVFAESCYAIKPMLVANTQLILGGEEKLAELYVSAQNICGEEFSMNAFGPTNLGGNWCGVQQKLTAVPATCQQNVCQAHLQ
jgi:hypothetical protein